MRLRTIGTHRLTDLERREHANDGWTSDEANEQSRQRRKHGAESDEVKDPQCADLILKMLGEPEQHVSDLPRSVRSDD